MTDSRKSTNRLTKRNRNNLPSEQLAESLLRHVESSQQDNSSDQINKIKSNLELLKNCTEQSPCGLLACRVCGDKTIEAEQHRTAGRFQQISANSNLLPYSFTIRSAAWRYGLDDLTIPKQELGSLVTGLVQDIGAELYGFNLDISPASQSPDSLLAHLHGTVWVDHASCVTRSGLLTKSNQLNVLARPIPVISSNNPLLDRRVSVQDLTRWAKYQTKSLDTKAFRKQSLAKIALQAGPPLQWSNLYDKPVSPLLNRAIAAVSNPSGCRYSDQLAVQLLTALSSLPKHQQGRVDEYEFAAIKKLVIRLASVDELEINQRYSLAKNASENRRLISSLLILISIVWLSLHGSVEHDNLLDLLGQQWPVAKKLSPNGKSHLGFWTSWQALLTADPKHLK